VQLDLDSLGGLKGIAAVILGMLGAGTLGGPLLRKLPAWLRTLLQSFLAPKPPAPVPFEGAVNGTSGRSSDQPPPVGFVTHLELIRSAAPAGTEAVWWTYALQGFTEAQVSKAEAALVTRPGVTNPS
jgi:hypothetical protein